MEGSKMNCWKSINLTKEFGTNRINIVSFLIGLLSFIFLYVPISIIQGSTHVNDIGLFPLLVALIVLPTIHSFMHILPLFFMNKRLKIINKRKKTILPVFTYYTKLHLTKKVSLLVAITPTIFVTVPGIVASYIFKDYSVYILLFTAAHIGISFIDYLYMIHIIKAPKEAYIENSADGFDILIKAPHP